MKKIIQLTLTFVLCLNFTILQAENLLKDGGLETVGKPGSPWNLREGTVSTELTHSGTQAVRLEAEEPGWHGIKQTITFDPPLDTPLRFGGWAHVDPEKPVRNVGANNADFDVYIDAHYTDDTPLWGVRASWNPSSSGWQLAEGTIFPEKPIKTLEVFVFLRQMTGAAAYDDIFVEPLPLEVRSLRAVGGLTGDGSFLLSGNLSWNVGKWKDGITLDLQEILPDGTTRPAQADAFLYGTSFLWMGAASETPAENRTLRILCSRNGKVVSQKDVTLSTRAVCPGKSILVWTESPMKRVFLHTFPESGSREIKTGFENPSYALALARNEYESFQIAVLSNRDVQNVAVEFSDLKNEQNPELKIGRENLDWKQVGYVLADELTPHSRDTEGVPGYWPDTLLPLPAGRLWKNRTMSFWVTVYAPETTAPGIYHGTVTLTPEGGEPIEVALRVEVWNLTLPAESRLASAFALMDGFLERVYGTVTPELRRSYGEMLIRNRLSPEGDITRTELPNLELLQAYKNRGLGKFCVLNLVRPRGKAPWRPNEEPDFYTPEQCAEFLAQLRPYVAELRRLGLANQAYIYTFDERGPDHHPAMTQFFGMVKENFPELATFTTAYIGSDLELMNRLNVDWTCPLTPRYNLAEAEACRKVGKQVWAYVCCGPGEPYANIMFHNPLIEARILGWQAFERQYDGLLYWGVNIWSYGKCVPIDLSDPEHALFTNYETSWVCGKRRIYGDGLLLYPAADGTPIGCIRLANLRDAFDDYEYLHLLKDKRGLDRARALCPPVFVSPSEFTYTPEVLETQRRKIAEMLKD